MKIALSAILGVGFGALLLWLSISHVDIGNVKSAMAEARYAPMVIAVALYWTAVAIRISRWRLLLSKTKLLAYVEVGRSLIIGYTVNNLLPARLGELFRVDFIAREYGMARSAVLGSVIMERLADAIAVVLLLAFGLAFATFKKDTSAFAFAALLAATAISFVIGGLCVVVLWQERLLRNRFRWLSDRLNILTLSISEFGGGMIISISTMTVVIWFLEMAAVASVISGFGVMVNVPGLSLICGSAAVSTLLPSAPGYIGSMQAAFVLAFSALGLASVLALLSATAVQLLLLGSVTIVGLLMIFTSQLSNLVTLVNRKH